MSAVGVSILATVQAATLSVANIWQGVAIAAVLASAPIAALAPVVGESSLAALGGGMTVAGIATTPGGNWVGPIMAVVGFLLLMSGASQSPQMTLRLVAMLISYGAGLTVAVYAALGEILVWKTALAIALAVAIVLSTWWKQPDPRLAGDV